METRKKLAMAAAVLALCGLCGCGIRNYIAQGPALSPKGQEAWLLKETAPVTYTGGARVPYPIPPFQVFGLKYDEVFVLESTNPHWSMHEFAKVAAGDKTVWLVNASDMKGIQTVTADLPDIDHWYPEIPVPRHFSPIRVADASTPEKLDVTLEYTDSVGQNTVVHFESPRPPEEVADRNGSTFTHSAQALSALLDIPAHQEKGVKAEISFDGKPARIRKVLGFFPVKALLVQVQAGFAVASMRIDPAASDRITVERPVPGTKWPASSTETWRIQPDRLSYERDTGSWEYLLNDGGVSSADVYQAGIEKPLFRLLISAPLPDFSRPFQGRVVRHFVAEMDGQCNGYGRMEAWMDEGGDAFLDILPVAPRWFAQRPLRTSIRFHGSQVDVVTERIPNK